MSRSRLAIVAVVAVSLLLLAGLYLRGRSSSAETAVATRGTIDVTIQTVGAIQAPTATLVRSRVGGTVERLGAGLGDEVAAGDILVTLDRAPFERGVSDLSGQLEQAEFALQFAEQRLAESPDDRTRQLEVLQAADRVARAATSLEDARRNLTNTIVVAPVSGVVIEVLTRAGDAVGQNQPVARVLARTDLVLVADVDELDMPNVRPGAGVTFRLDAYPATEVSGVVRATAPTARQQGGATVFSTTIDFLAIDDLDIRPGMNADVTIVTEARENVLLIPERALRTVGGRSFVGVKLDDGEEEREVTLGYRGQGQVEVVAGLSEGERVLLR